MWFADISQILTIIVIQLLRHVAFVCVCVQANREFRMAAATSEYHAVSWSCSGSVGCPRFFCYDLPGRRVGHNCTSMWHIKVNFIFLTCLQSINMYLYL